MIGAAIGGMFNFMGNLWNGFRQSQQNEENLRVQQKLQKEQNDFNLDMWNRQNAYNDPMAQLNRYEKAGINPSAVMTNIQPGEAQQLTSANPAVPNLQAPQVDFSPIMQMAQMMQQQKLIDSEAEKNYADAGRSRAQTKTEDAIRESVVRYQSALADKTVEEKQQVIENTNLLKSNKALVDMQKDLTETQKKQTDIITQFLPLMQLGQLYKLVGEIENLQENAKLTRGQQAALRVTMALTRAQIGVAHAQQRKENALAAGQEQSNDIQAATSATTINATNAANDKNTATSNLEKGLVEKGIDPNKSGTDNAVYGGLLGIDNLHDWLFDDIIKPFIQFFDIKDSVLDEQYPGLMPGSKGSHTNPKMRLKW